jgi:hypothetical protein
LIGDSTTLFLCVEVIFEHVYILKYRVAHKLPDTLLLRITFDRNQVESCGFHRSKEDVSMHRLIYY